MDFLKNLFSGSKQSTPKSTDFNSFMSNYTQPTTNYNKVGNQPVVSNAPNISTQTGPKYISPTASSSPVNLPTIKRQPVSTTIPASSLSTETTPIPDFSFAPTTSNVMDTLPVFGSEDTEQKATSSKPKTLQESVQERLATQLSGGSAIDTSAIREQLQIDQKRKRSKDLENAILQKQQQVQKQVEALEKNPEGVFGGALNAQINKLSREASRELADLSIAYKIANDDYQGVQSTLQAYEKDLKDQRDYELQVMNQAMDFLQNDLSESEKMQIQQNFKLQEIDYENQFKELASSQEIAQQQAQAQPWVTAISNGTTQLKDVPKELQTSVVSLMNQSGVVDPTTKAKTQSDLSLADNLFELINDPALGASTGFLGSRLPSLKTLTGATTDFKRAFEQVKGALTVGNLGLMSGVLSETDIKILADEATKLNLDLSKDEFIKEAKNLHSLYVSKIIEKPFVDVQTKKQVLTDKILLDDPNKSDEEVAEEVNTLIKAYLPQTSFNSAGNASASVQIPQSSRLAYVNNNPANLRFAGQSGATEGEGGFARFNSPQEGYNALLRQIELDKSRNLSVSKFINKFAPPTENDTNSYINFVVNSLGVSPTTNISQIPTPQLAKVMALKESSTKIA